MENQILYLALAVLAFAVALNLKISMAVLRASRRERDAPELLPTGQPVPIVSARKLHDGKTVQLVGNGQATVLLFLSSKCPKCRTKLAELEEMIPLADQAGLAIWLVSEESAWRLRRFVSSKTLLARVARVSLQHYKALNVSLMSPGYLFINHEDVLEAIGFIGDENWLGLRAQLNQEAPINPAQESAA